MFDVNNPAQLILATRKSTLAICQTEIIRTRLLQLYPFCDVQILGIATEGDKNLNTPLAQFGGKGVFINALEAALLEGRADMAVHSLKDMPSTLESSYAIAAMPIREDARDALISPRFNSLNALPYGAVVGTSSLRRAIQLKRLRSDITIQPLRGNVQTRLSKLDSGNFDAIILAAAGLHRLNLANRITQYFSVEQITPAIGQGVLAIECLSSRTDVLNWVKPLQNASVTACAIAERKVGESLGGNCHLPLAAYAWHENGYLFLSARLLSPENECLETVQKGSLKNAEALGENVAAALKGQGAKMVMREWGCNI